MPIPQFATEHPQALEEGEDIARAGSIAHVHALGELIGALDLLFDGPGNPPYRKATACVDDLFFEHPRHGAIRIFARAFWGSDDCGVVAAVCLVEDRPILTAVVAIGLPPPFANLTEAAAHDAAVRAAIARCVDL